jgi:hypothetical protein
MTGFEVVVGVIAAFFIIGIVVGVIAVIAMSALKPARVRPGARPSGRTRRRGGGPAHPSGDGGPGWEEPPGPNETDGGNPRWPGGPAV